MAGLKTRNYNTAGLKTRNYNTAGLKTRNYNMAGLKTRNYVRPSRGSISGSTWRRRERLTGTCEPSDSTSSRPPASWTSRTSWMLTMAARCTRTKRCGSSRP